MLAAAGDGIWDGAATEMSIRAAMAGRRSSLGGDDDLGYGDDEDGEEEVSVESLRRSWAAELSEAMHGLGVARLIFNADGSEDKEIASLLTEALALREEMELYAQV